MFAEDIHIGTVWYLSIGSKFIVLKGNVSQERLSVKGLLSTDDIKT